MNANNDNDDEFNIFVGGGVAKRGYDHGENIAIEKNAIELKLVPDSISECALYLEANGIKKTGTCLSDATAGKITASLHADSIVDAKKRLGCNTDRCVLEKMEPIIGSEVVDMESKLFLKIAGPTDVKLLSNVNIDATLQQWAQMYRDFYPYNFHMRNFTSYCYRNGHILHEPDTLATISFTDLYNKDRGGSKNSAINAGYRCAGCVINTDVYQGPGEHWMALFADARGDNEWTVEFFNSSGNSPAPEWVNWMEKTKVCMENIIVQNNSNIRQNSNNQPKPPIIRMVKSSSIRHQRSRTECGLYSLFYIWARLNKIPVEYFSTNHVPDQLMFEFRQHLFDDPTRPAVKKFDWDEYAKNTRVRWE